MKKLIFLAGLALGVLCFGPMRPAFASSTDSTFFSSSTMVNVSTSMITGATKILSAQSQTQTVCLWALPTVGVVNEQIAIDSQVNVSTVTGATGSFRFPVSQMTSAALGQFNASTSVAPFCLENYRGPLWALVVGTTTLNVAVMRKQ